MIVEQLGKLPLCGTFKQMADWFKSKRWNAPGTDELSGAASQIIQQVGAGDMGEDVGKISLRRVFHAIVSYCLFGVN